MTVLTRIIKRLDNLNLPQPKPICWIILNGEYHYGSYCPDCAEKVVDYCFDGFDDKEGYFDEESQLPTEEEYGDIEDAYHVKSHDRLQDGVELCHACGKHLSVILTESGVESELNHFEMVEAIDTERELREIYDIFWAIMFSHAGKDCEYYDRAVNLAEEIEPMITKLEEECKSDFEDYGKLFDTVEGIRVTKQMVINKKTGVIKPKNDQHYVPLSQVSPARGEEA